MMIELDDEELYRQEKKKIEKILFLFDRIFHSKYFVLKTRSVLSCVFEVIFFLYSRWPLKAFETDETSRILHLLSLVFIF